MFACLLRLPTGEIPLKSTSFYDKSILVIYNLLWKSCIVVWKEKSVCMTMMFSHCTFASICIFSHLTWNKPINWPIFHVSPKRVNDYVNLSYVIFFCLIMFSVCRPHCRVKGKICLHDYDVFALQICFDVYLQPFDMKQTDQLTYFPRFAKTGKWLR